MKIFSWPSLLILYGLIRSTDDLYHGMAYVFLLVNCRVLSFVNCFFWQALQILMWVCMSPLSLGHKYNDPIMDVVCTSCTNYYRLSGYSQHNNWVMYTEFPYVWQFRLHKNIWYFSLWALVYLTVLCLSVDNCLLFGIFMEMFHRPTCWNICFHI